MTDAYAPRAVDGFCVGAVGKPGERVFYLQATEGTIATTIKTEKEHVIALALGLAEMMRDTGLEPDPATTIELREPFTPVFEARQIGIGYQDDPSRFVLLLREFAQEDPTVELGGDDPDAGGPNSGNPNSGNPGSEEGGQAAFWITPAQAAAFCRQAQFVVEVGRDFGQRNGHHPGLR